MGHKSDGKRGSITYSSNREKRDRTFYCLSIKTDVESLKVKRTEFYDPCAWRMGHKSDGKRGSITYSSNREKRDRTFYCLSIKTDVESLKAQNIRLILIIRNNAKLHKKNRSSIQRFSGRNCGTKFCL